MIHRQSVPQSSRATTIGAAAAKVVQRGLPIGLREIVGQFYLARLVAMHNYAQLITVICPILAHSLPIPFSIFQSPLPHFFLVVGVVTLVVAFALALRFKIAGAPFTVGLAASLSILRVMLALPCAAFLWVLCPPSGNLLSGAYLALGAQSARAAALFCEKVFSRRGQFLAAFGTYFHRIHSSNYSDFSLHFGLQEPV